MINKVDVCPLPEFKKILNDHTSGLKLGEELFNEKKLNREESNFYAMAKDKVKLNKDLELHRKKSKNSE